MKHCKIILLLLATALLWPLGASAKVENESIEDKAQQSAALKTVPKFMAECVKNGFPATCFVSEVRTPKAFKGKAKKWEWYDGDWTKFNIQNLFFRNPETVIVRGVFTDEDDDLESEEMEFHLHRRTGKWQIFNVENNEDSEVYDFKAGKWKDVDEGKSIDLELDDEE